MRFEKTEFEGIWLLQNYLFKDNRGNFVKIYNKDNFGDLNIEFEEIFYSKSKKSVIRGMHFQTPPYDHKKLIFVIEGEILDVNLDLRKNSSTYQQFYSCHLSEGNQKSLLISEGFAHGFCVLSDMAIVGYCMTKGYAPQNDSGILWDSFGMEWPVEKPILSQRDLSFPKFEEYKSPF